MEGLIDIAITSSVAICIAFAFAGLWRATHPDPDFLADERLFSCRRLTRLALPCSILGVVVMSLNESFGRSYTTWWPYWIEKFSLLLIILGSAGVVALLLMHGRKIARMIPHRPLARAAMLSSLSLLSAPILILIIDTASEMLICYLWSGVSYANYDWIETIQNVAWLGTLVCLVWAGLTCLWLVPLSFWFRHAMAKEASAAESTWAAVSLAEVRGTEPHTQ